MTTSALAPFRLIPGETDDAYIRRMRDTYGAEWYSLPICCGGRSLCIRAPVLRITLTPNLSRTLYYCARHARHAEEYRTGWQARFVSAIEPFRCPPRIAGKPFHL